MSTAHEGNRGRTPPETGEVEAMVDINIYNIAVHTATVCTIFGIPGYLLTY